MHNRKNFYALLLLVSLLFVVNAVDARNDVICVKPEQKAVRILALTASDEVSGDVSAENGVIDFYISSSAGDVLTCNNQTNGTSFSFVAPENDNYTFCFINSLSNETVEVALNYIIKIVRNANVNLNVNVGTSAGVARVVAAPPLEQPEDTPDLEDLYAKYLNFRKADELLRIVRSTLQYMPLRETVMVLGFASLMAVLVEVPRHIRRSRLPSQARVLRK